MDKIGVHKCHNCWRVIDVKVFHCMIDGWDADFCSEKCIRKYSKAHSHVRIVLIETFIVPEKVIFT